MTVSEAAKQAIENAIRAVSRDIEDSGWGRHGMGDSVEEEAGRRVANAIVSLVRKNEVSHG